LLSGNDWAQWGHVAYTPPDRMLQTLAYLDERHSGAYAYLRKHGVAAPTLTALHSLLTEPIT
jgi:hypothetical protein